MKDQNTIHHAYNAYKILYAGFIVLPILAGFDKFFHIFVDWNTYLSPIVAGFIDPGLFMKVVGVVEMAAGVLVVFNPRIGGYVIAFWLWAIIANLLSIPGYFDIALRDFGLSLGALSLAQLGKAYFIPLRNKSFA